MMKSNLLSSTFILTFSILNGVYASAILPSPEENGPYFQGDLRLTPGFLSGRVDSRYRWLNRTVHYEFEPGYPMKLQETFLLATQHISNRTCIRFESRSSSNQDYLYVTGTQSTACYSYVGRQGGRQVMSLPPACDYLGTFIHELLHVVGFHHEQSRTDRDDHVRINWDNILKGKESQFRKYDSATVTAFGVPYDYGSILHYSQTTFSKDPANLDTIVPLVSGVKIGQREGMSEGDAMKVNRMYDCA